MPPSVGVMPDTAASEGAVGLLTLGHSSHLYPKVGICTFGVSLISLRPVGEQTIRQPLESGPQAVNLSHMGCEVRLDVLRHKLSSYSPYKTVAW